jgi:tRNA 2-selenouridine synthase
MGYPDLKKIGIIEFLKLRYDLPVIDVRSPSEYSAGHIPGAINIPLFNDQEREAVGIKYKKEGRINAILKGLELAGPSMQEKLSDAIKAAPAGKLLVHCWRGGMRSEAMAWLFSLGDIKCEVLEGGYKSYRNHILASICAKRRIIILGGMTGTSKTHILRQIKIRGKQVIDLESIANHKGSAFGALGQPPQPTTEHFAILLYEEWSPLNSEEPVWLEDESRNIGTVFMPDTFYTNMQGSPAIILLLALEKRMPRLIEEYSTYQPELLRDSIMRISKRLGGDNTKEAVDAVDSGDFARAIEITLKYYDKAYLFSIKRKPSGNIIYIESDTDDITANTEKALEASKKITW